MSSFDKTFEVLAELQAQHDAAGEKLRQLYRALVYREQESLYGFPSLPLTFRPPGLRCAISRARDADLPCVEWRGYSMTLRYAELILNEKY